PSRPTLFPYTTLFRSARDRSPLRHSDDVRRSGSSASDAHLEPVRRTAPMPPTVAESRRWRRVGGNRGADRLVHHVGSGAVNAGADRKSTRLNSSHVKI